MTMGLLRRKKDESGRSLLDSSKRGFLGFRKSGPDGRSDNPGVTKSGLSSATHWGKVRAPVTPPLTPRSPVDENEVVHPKAPISNVTLVKGSSKASKTSSPLNSPTKNAKVETVPDDNSEYSDLTDNRTQQRLIEQKAVYERIIEERKMRETALLDIPHRASDSADPSIVQKGSSSNMKTASAKSTSETKNPLDIGFFADLFGLMDLACKPSGSGKDDEKTYAPEWGVAPTHDDTTEIGKHRPQSTDQKPGKGMNNTNERGAPRGASPVFADSDSGSEYEEEGGTATVEDYDDDVFSDVDNSQPSSYQQQQQQLLERGGPPSPKSTHENFEMVLEELEEEEFSPKRRPWMKNPFNRGKRGEPDAAAQGYVVEESQSNEEDVKIAPDKAHQDMIKQALFPDYEIPEKKKPAAAPKDNATPIGLPPQPHLQQPVAATMPPTKQPYRNQVKPPEMEAAPPKQSKAPQKKQPAVAPPGRSPNEPYNKHEDMEEKKEEIPDPGLELPERKNDGRTKKRIGKAILGSLRRRAKHKSVTLLEPVKEGEPSAPSEIHVNARPIALRGTFSSGRRGISRSASGDKTNGSRSETDQSSEPRSYESKNENMGLETASAGGGRLTPLVQAADSKDHGDANDPGFVGGFMAMISETVAAVQAGKPIPEEVQRIPDKNPRSIQQSKTWKEGENKVEKKNSREAGVDSSDLRRSRSAPHNVGEKQFKRRKQVWKEVKDPTSGRSYYYHRITRQTTWTKPKEMDAQLDEEANQTKDRQQSKEINPSTYQDGQVPRTRSIQRSTSTEEKLEQLRQSRGAKGCNLESVRKTSARDFDPNVWNQKQKIVELLQSMAPPDGTSIESLMAQYEGRENELLEHVRRMKDSRPFDEPIGDDENADGALAGESTPPGVNDSMQTRGSSHASFVRSASGVTSRQSESTQLVKNTKGPRRLEDNTIGGSTLSSNHHKGLSPRTSATEPTLQRIPSKIPALRVRSRELMVEEFSQERYKLETFNKDLSKIQKQPNPVRVRPFTTPYGTATIDEEEELNDADSSHANDTISALSVNEFEFIQPVAVQDGLEEARRRALDEAIRREDWDEAATISDKMRGGPSKDDVARRRPHAGEWKQSELDRFISENDWEAVSDYIAHLRSKSKAEYRGGGGDSDNRKSKAAQRGKGKYSDMISSGSKPPSDSKSNLGYSGHRNGDDEPKRDNTTKKRFGARSQLQHNVERSSSSEVSESEEEESDYYSSESSSSAPPRKPRFDRRRSGGSQRKRSSRRTSQGRY